MTRSDLAVVLGRQSKPFVNLMRLKTSKNNIQQSATVVKFTNNQVKSGQKKIEMFSSYLHLKYHQLSIKVHLSLIRTHQDHKTSRGGEPGAVWCFTKLLHVFFWLLSLMIHDVAAQKLSLCLCSLPSYVSLYYLAFIPQRGVLLCLSFCVCLFVFIFVCFCVLCYVHSLLFTWL